MLHPKDSPHGTPEQHGGPGWPAMLSRSVLLSAAASFVAYQVLSHVGVPTQQALAATAILPVAGLALGWTTRRGLLARTLPASVVLATSPALR